MSSATRLTAAICAILSAAALRASSDLRDRDPVDPSGLGGPATTDSREPNAFSLPVPGLDTSSRRDFAVENSFFRRNWVTSPASVKQRDGLGPQFNARSCSACHTEDGRGRPPRDVDELATGLIVRISPHDADGQPHAIYGDQIQDQAIIGHQPEACIELQKLLTHGLYPDGAEYELLEWRLRLATPSGEAIDDVRTSVRVSQQLIGVGLLEAIDDSDVSALADEEDADGDGISGRPHWVIDPRTGERALGRFGWKAGRPDLETQIAVALREDLGITSPVFPGESLESVEIDQRALDRLVHYCRVLGVPRQRDAESSIVRRGRELFESVSCTSCHVPSLRTGAHSRIEAFHDAVIHPYTDLLLHDMGDGLADDRCEGEATGREWRTPPLWGVGLIETVNGHTRFLHDGRARSLEEAILWHGGEAAESRRRFMELPREDRLALLAFLNSL